MTRETGVVDVPGGGRLHTYAAAEPRAVLVLGHGAGGGIDAFDLQALAEAMPAHGVTVVLHEQPWRMAGNKVAPPPTRLDAAWAPTLAAIAAAHRGLPLFVGGRSAGARVACRGAANSDLPGQAGVVALSFPLHPPGRPDKSRAPELAGSPVPVLVVQGERDPFGTPSEIESGVPGTHVVVIDGAGHDLRPSRREAVLAGVGAQIVEAVLAFVWPSSTL